MYSEKESPRFWPRSFNVLLRSHSGRTEISPFFSRIDTSDADVIIGDPYTLKTQARPSATAESLSRSPFRLRTCSSIQR
jgi:hypothetical protein